MYILIPDNLFDKLIEQYEIYLQFQKIIIYLLNQMPPKTKKDAEDQAKRLEEERKKKQEQQARLELERKKYLSQKLATGLLLPTSNQLVADYAHKKKDFISQKLKEAIKQAYPAVLQSTRIQFVLKELHYFIKDSLQLFGPVPEGSICPKHRIFVGIMLTILLNNDIQATGQNKNRPEDQRIARELVTVHCKKIEGLDSLTKNEGLLILNYAKQKYFSKFQLMKLFDKFKKKQTQQMHPIYIETPNLYFNQEATPFTDLSNHAELQKPKVS